MVPVRRSAISVVADGRVRWESDVTARGIKSAMAAGALVAAGVLAMPAAGRQADKAHVAARHLPPRPALAFTPAAADPRLAAVFARGGLDTGGFRFTPTGARRDGDAVTVVVRARTNHVDASRLAAATTPTLGIAPIAYSLGAGVGWRRVGVTGDLSHVDMGLAPGGREATDVTVTYTGDRVTGRVKGVVDRPFASIAPALDTDHSYAVDIGGSYRLTRRLDLTAGVRYRMDRDELLRLDDTRHDSQAVYVGTAFKF
jgi:hypothetical protein